MKPQFETGQMVRSNRCEGLTGLVVAVGPRQVLCLFPNRYPDRTVQQLAFSSRDIDEGQLEPARNAGALLHTLEPGDQFAWWDPDACTYREMLVTDLKMPDQCRSVWACDIEHGTVVGVRPDRLVIPIRTY
jgi:hypothetical protein